MSYGHGYDSLRERIQIRTGYGKGHTEWSLAEFQRQRFCFSQDVLPSWYRCVTIHVRSCQAGMFTRALVSRVFIGALLHRRDWLTAHWLIAHQSPVFQLNPSTPVWADAHGPRCLPGITGTLLSLGKFQEFKGLLLRSFGLGKFFYSFLLHSLLQSKYSTNVYEYL